MKYISESVYCTQTMRLDYSRQCLRACNSVHLTTKQFQRFTDLQGGELVSQVYALTEQGSPFERDYGRRLLPRVCVPLFKFILKWIQEGALDDPHGEFFVSASSHTNDAPSGHLSAGARR